MVMTREPGFRAAEDFDEPQRWGLPSNSSRKITETKVIDENLARLRTHRNNVHRYRRLLETGLTELERSYIERRLHEEQLAIDALSAETFPFTLPARPIPPATA